MKSQSRVSSYSLFWLGLFILVLDQSIKGWVTFFLPVTQSLLYSYPYGGLPIFSLGGIDFSINHMTNTGAAWGVFSHYQLPLLGLRIVLIIGLISYLFGFQKSPSGRIPLMLIIAGAIGNVLDFFLYGHVVDMFHFVLWGYDFPVFNVADSSISIGIFSLLILSLFKKDV